MKKVLFATTAFTALAVGGTAMADITLYGSARLGLYYEEDADNELTTTSRTRFGVTMSGETDSGITFGADMRADNVADPLDGADSGQAGSAFISGAFGTLTYGDTSGADENWVGDLVGNLSLTGLGDLNETLYLSNGGELDSDDPDSVINPAARPTIRYDFDLAGFGISLSSDNDLSDVGVGAGYAGPVAGFDMEFGIGYYDFNDFAFGDESLDGEEYSAMLGFGFLGADMNVIYNKVDPDGGLERETLGVGAEYAFDAFAVGAFYRNTLSASNDDGDTAEIDGDDAFGLTAEYDLGGGATLNGGIVSDYQDDIVADFGVNMSF